jgi:hypothetical protein
LVATLTQTIMKVRRDLLVEQPIFAQITAPSTDADANVPLHPGRRPSTTALNKALWMNTEIGFI